MRFSGRLLAAAAVLAGLVAAPAVLAEELTLDPNALDASTAAPKPNNKKSAKQAPAQASSAAKPGKPGGDRQFGELEGWSPGKTPPKEKQDDAPSSSSGKAPPVSFSPSGNMSVGLPF